jgi:hypothetical protein
MPVVTPVPLSVEMDSGNGPWEWYLHHKGNSTTTQKYLVPWLIALHGIGYSKIKKTKCQISDMLIALCTEHKLLAATTTLSPAQAAELYPIAFADVCEKARNAASKPILLQYISE